MIDYLIKMAYTNILIAILFIASVHAQQAEKLIQNPCVSKATCSECIQMPTCAWCFQPNFGDQKRCYQPAGQNSELCPEEYTWNPDNEFRSIMQKELSKAHSASSSGSASSGWSSSGSSSGSNSWSSSSGSSWGGSASGSSSEIVQISPQHVNLKLRIKEAYRLTMFYTQAEDYPVDLYYLMDLSKSMEDDKDKLSSLGSLLAESMRNITSNFRLGFGSFVDKVVMPYVSTVPQKLKAPCVNCEPPYGFKNHLTLSTNTNQFSQMVKEAAVSGNLDAPEGGFDAIMQAVVCRRQIGWREKARRLLVFSTDSGFHYAGDGKLGGIIKPNDGLCHLDARGLYTDSSLQDYPSISQINLKVKQNAINVIFAVTEEQIGIYKQLQGHIEGASSGKLSADSANVVDLVKEQYQQISSSVEMKDNAQSNIRVSYYSSCLVPGGPMKQTSKCENIKVGDVVSFAVDIEVTQCPKDPKNWKQTLQIYPVGLNESLTIDLEMLCQCPCEIPGNYGYIEKATECREFGTYKCGICECDALHFGRHCECSASESGDIDLTFGCRPDNTTSVDCSGQGTCVCGQCECEEREDKEEVVSGQFCECDNFSCDRYKGILCSGPDHGTCVCGRCDCLPQWSGTSCNCLKSNDTCYPPDGGEMCSGHGTCECGKCDCDVSEEGRYSGKHCEKCPTCPGRCLEFKECVQCQMYKTGPLSEEECAENCTFVPEPVKQIEASEEKDENLCAYYDEDDCRFAYVYWYDENNKIMIRAQEERECPRKVFVLGIVLGVMAAIVLMGLALLLLWKLLTTIHDRREFARFEKERMMAKWDTGENPIYKQATSTFKNPTYAGKG